MSEPRRIGEILDPALARLATSDRGRAYAAWARAAGTQIAGGAHPKAFNRGILTVECSSSVWASELTYLSDRLLRRMREVAPDHPVKRLKFMVGRGGSAAGEAAEDGSDVAAAGRKGTGAHTVRTLGGQDVAPAASKEKGRDEGPAPPDLGEARDRAREVRDERLRAAIQAALRAAGGAAPATPGDSPP